MLYYQNTQIGPAGLRGAVKFLVIANVLAWFVLVVILQGFFFKSDLVFQWLGFVPHRVVFQFCWWQFVSYMFIHSTGVFHILINMLILWMFGSDLEQQRWGKRFFLIYYMVCGVGAGVVYVLAMYVYGLLGGDIARVSDVPVVGASGAVFGLLLAYGWVFKDRPVYFMLIFPMRARTFACVVAAVELVQVLSYGFGHPVAGLAHLGGLISGFVFLYFRKIQDQGWGGGWPSWRRKIKFSSIKPVTKDSLH